VIETVREKTFLYNFLWEIEIMNTAQWDLDCFEELPEIMREKLQVQPISLIMNKNPSTVHVDDPVEEVQRIVNTGISIVPVLDSSGRCFGVISAADLVRFSKDARKAKAVPAWEICTHKLVTVDIKSSIIITCRALLEGSVRQIVVTENGFFAGLVSSQSILAKIFSTLMFPLSGNKKCDVAGDIESVGNRNVPRVVNF